jgi:hypothetical protein
MNGVVCCLLAAVSVLAALGIRYPLQLLPILFFELVWKSIWLAAVALPLWIGGQMDEQSMSTVIDCLVGVILMPLAIPWAFVVSNYVKRPGDRWRRVAPSQVESTESAVIGNPTGIRQ